MRQSGPLGGADKRPRIHIWPQGFGPRWSIGPTGARIPAKTLGDAVEQALAEIEFKPCVIIYEAMP